MASQGVLTSAGTRTRGRVPVRGVLVGGAMLGAAVIAGAAATTPLGILLAALAVFGVALGWALSSWRRSIVAVVYYMPFSGLLPLAMYPNSAPGVLAKDLLFVLPAYIAAIVAVATRRERLTLPGAPVLLFGAFAALVTVQVINPHEPEFLVGPIGMKVWLFTPPLMVLGYHLFSRPEGLRRMLKVMFVLSIIPCVVGIIEALLVAAGQQALVYSWYGPAASAATQDFAAFDFGGGTFARLPSLFTAVSQYWLFTSASLAVGYAAWRGSPRDPFLRWFGPLGLGVIAVASMTAGTRAAFIFTPLLIMMVALLEGVPLRRLVLYAGGLAVSMLAVLQALHIDPTALASSSSEHTSFIFSFFGDGFRLATHHMIGGLGTGVDTNAARYAFDTVDYGVIYKTVGGVWWESWYLKAFLELGIVGLVILAMLVVSVVRRSLIVHRQIQDPAIRSMSAAFLGLFVWNVIFAIKTAYIDVDPMVIYVWLLLGIQWRLADMDRGERERAAEASSLAAGGA